MITLLIRIRSFAGRAICCAHLLFWIALAWHGGEAYAEGYAVELIVPGKYRSLLHDNLEIYRWLDNPRMSPEHMKRLYKRTPDDIRKLMETEGFFSPEIESGLNERSGNWLAHFTVNPGNPVRVDQVAIRLQGELSKANESRSRLAKIRADWPLKTGAVFRQEDWEKAKRGALQHLLANGYPTASVGFSQATINPESRQAALEIAIDSGPAFTFGELQISGLKRYPRSIVERLSTIEPGMPYSQEKLLALQQSLQDTLYFSVALVSAETDPAHPDRVPVKVELTENPARKIGFGVGASTNTGARIQADYQDLNFFDQAWRLSSTLKLETKKQSLTGEVRLPTTAAGYRDSVNALLERTDIEGETTRKLGFGAQRGQVRGDIETALALQYLAERQDVAGSDSTFNKALTLNYSWTQRRVDNLLFPTRGYLFNAQLGGGLKIALSGQNFTRGYTKFTYFYPLGKADNLIFRGEAGVVAAPSRDGIPTDFLFRAGGDQSVRGYAYQSLGVAEGDAIVGGRYLATASAEYVHWLSSKWGMAAFIDAGNAVDDLNNFEIAQGYGVGARWKSPVGPLNMDLAYGVETRKARLHFSVGFSF